ncbi:putative tricarboxylic transport membrane protein [Humitalea rosea]|uniref:Putative tricarboxylic transport membrane protein n=1 Tax=Humitalea rosea TaxID=990373 RepID=A0A2W7IHX8_9PROT|nr:tripartite tricarboxylate transporter TctB family protein [Humitalea rosea]PZW46515.1 putative tricarboxylic transport membrane protein [Humitalea rosea]
MSSGADDAPVSARADLATAAVLLALGIAIIVESWGMPRFVVQSGTGLTAPGIVPGFHGAMIVLLAGLLGLRSLRQAGTKGAPATDVGSVALTAALGLIYAVGLIGRLPFWLAAALFVFSFTACFEWRASAGRRVRRLAEAAVLGLLTGGAVTYVFERIFLVRLP